MGKKSLWTTKRTEVWYPELLSLTISRMKIKTTLKYGLTTIRNAY